MLGKKIILLPFICLYVFISHTHVHKAIVESAKLCEWAVQIHRVFCQCSNQGKCLTTCMELAGLFINFPYSPAERREGEMRAEDMRENSEAAAKITPINMTTAVAYAV